MLDFWKMSEDPEELEIDVDLPEPTPPEFDCFECWNCNCGKNCDCSGRDCYNQC